MDPLISFIVVTHNRPADLVFHRIIESIRKQTYQHKELILVGDQSPYLEEIAQKVLASTEFESFKSVNLERPIDNDMPPWALLGRARNFGIGLASGDFISCQDDDNELKQFFAVQMLNLLQVHNAQAAWCWREIAHADGTPYKGDFFPWGKEEENKKLLYKIWHQAGVISPGSSIVKDTLWARRGAETFTTVDSNEWLVRKNVFNVVPFRERYSYHEIRYDWSLDDIWAHDFCRSGLSAVCLEYPGLIYYLGGRSNAPGKL